MCGTISGCREAKSLFCCCFYPHLHFAVAVVLSSLSLFNAAGSIACPNLVDVGKNNKKTKNTVEAHIF
jgi:hypothetical protein